MAVTLIDQRLRRRRPREGGCSRI